MTKPASLILLGLILSGCNPVAAPLGELDKKHKPFVKYCEDGRAIYVTKKVGYTGMDIYVVPDAPECTEENN